MPAHTRVFVGCLNQPVPYFEAAHGRGITVFELDEQTGRLRLLAEVTDVVNPSYLTLLPERDMLYATSEVYGAAEGQLSAYRIDRYTGGLTLVGRQPTRGSIAAYCAIDQSRQCVLVVNYTYDAASSVPGQHVVSFAIRADGTPSPAVSEFAHEGRGPRDDRQAVPHAHCIATSPDNRFALVTDLGTDKVHTYAFDAAHASLWPSEVPALQLPPGAGPRHLVFHPDGKIVYVINELDSTICRLKYAPDTGLLSLVETRHALPSDAVPSHPAGLRVSPDGRFLYASFRGDDSIASYVLGTNDGALIASSLCKTGGRTPRDFTLSPSGRFMLVANQDSDLVTVFGVDPATGTLTEQVDAVALGSPLVVQAARFS